jgi:17 kDa common-antigen outer membrane protein
MRIVVFISVISLLMGCVSPQLVTSPTTQTLEQHSQPLEVISSAQERLPLGSQIRISDPAFPNGLQAIVGPEYYSALAQQCYRIKMLSSYQPYGMAALCKSKTGTWIVAPSVQSNHGGK